MCQVKRHFSVSVSISGSYDCVCASFFSIHIFFLLRLHLYYSHAIYRIKYSSLTFPIRFKACYFYVFTFVVVVVVVVASKAIHKKWPSIDKKNDSREMAQKKNERATVERTKNYINYIRCVGICTKSNWKWRFLWKDEYLLVSRTLSQSERHIHSVQIEKYVLLMTANGFNRA